MIKRLPNDDLNENIVQLFQHPAYAAAAAAITSTEIDTVTKVSTTATTTTTAAATTNDALSNDVTSKATKEAKQNGSAKPQKRQKPDNYDEG